MAEAASLEAITAASLGAFPVGFAAGYATSGEFERVIFVVVFTVGLDPLQHVERGLTGDAVLKQPGCELAAAAGALEQLVREIFGQVRRGRRADAIEHDLVDVLPAAKLEPLSEFARAAERRGALEADGADAGTALEVGDEDHEAVQALRA